MSEELPKLTLDESGFGPAPHMPPVPPEEPVAAAVPPLSIEAEAAALPSPPHGRFCRCPICEGARRGYRI